MGLGESKKYISEYEISDEECDVEFFKNPENLMPARETGHINIPDQIIENSVDAIMKPLHVEHDVMSLEQVKSIEEQLDKFEMVSLVYLLYSNSRSALHVLDEFVKCSKNGRLLYKWAQSEKKEGKKWQNKLLEALCIVQNYQILKSIGYNKVSLQHMFMPFQVETSCSVKKLRKVLYLIAEKLTKPQTIEFIQNMNKKLHGKLEYRGFNDDYLELYFLYWESCNLDVKDIQQVFKIMDLELISDQLNSVLPKKRLIVESNSEYSTQSVELGPASIENERKATTTKDNTYLQTGSFEDVSYITPRAGVPGIMQENSILDRYPVNPNNPGTVLIINQEAFYTEPDQKYMHLLHENKDEIQLEYRKGTTLDKERLEKLFEQMKFKVIMRENLTHYDMLKSIEEVTDGVLHESSLIICILSHGDNGVVYGANSCKVEVKKIESIMCKRSKRLVGKPKVLLLQSCQGKQCQKTEEESEDDDEDNATDAPTRTPKADLLTFWATIPGYAAIRNINRGSWFIQALCDEIEGGNSKFHFLDICTRAISNVTRREWKQESRINVMTPILYSTLTKSFFLPPLSA